MRRVSCVTSVVHSPRWRARSRLRSTARIRSGSPRSGPRCSTTAPDRRTSWPEHSRAAAVEPGEAWSKIVDPEGRGPSLHFHRVPETKVVKNRVHLDLRAPDDFPGDRRHQVDAEVERIVGLGARKVQGVTDEA